MIDKNLIKIDFYNFEAIVFNNKDLNNNNFYEILDQKNVNQLFKSYLQENYLDYTNLDKLFIKDIEYLLKFLKKKNINFSSFSYFKSEKDVLNSYLLLFLLKTFAVKSKLKHTAEEISNASIKKYLIDRNDFINIFLDYIFKFFLFFEIKEKENFRFTREELRKFSFRYIELCYKKKLITIDDVTISNKSYKILHFSSFNIFYSPHIVFYSSVFQHYIRSETEFYVYNNHFYSIFEVTRTAKYSNASFKIPIEQVEILLKRPFYIDRNFLEKAFDELLKEQQLNFNSDLNIKIENLSKKMEKFITEKDLISLQLCHSKLSKFLTLIRIKTILSMCFDEKKIYLPFMFCFRGRIYELTDLSFTFYKEFRFCLYLGIYEKEEEKFHPISANIQNTLKKQFHLLEKLEWFLNLPLIRKYAIIWVFVSIGALKKVELGKEVHISNFIKKGIEMWKNCKNINFSDIYEKIEFIYLLDMLNELITIKFCLKKRVFWKDAPASCFQHQLLILGASNENSYKNCNLDSEDTWYDPYSFLIMDFFEKNRDLVTNNIYSESKLMLNSNQYFEIFSRKRLKKVLMTESYGAGRQKLTFFFTLDLNLEERPSEEKNAILAIWKDFFKFISDKNPLFAQSSKNIVECFESNNLFVVKSPDGTIVDHSCFTVEIIQKEIYVQKKRHTLQTKTFTKEPDNDQFSISIRANFVQSQDAILARKYIMLTNMWSIHDCFSIDVLNITYMVALINEMMNGEFYDLKIRIGEKKTIYSIFIIL